METFDFPIIYNIDNESSWSGPNGAVFLWSTIYWGHLCQIDYSV